MQDLIGYDEIIENSMRMVVFHTLKKIEKKPLPGKHYFTISFLTEFPGVFIANDLREKFPDEMTIAIQYQYRNLTVNNDSFSIELSFSGFFQKLVIPFNSITSFADPSFNFALKFSKKNKQNLSSISQQKNSDSQASQDDDSEVSKIDLSSKIISLDAFRKLKDKE